MKHNTKCIKDKTMVRKYSPSKIQGYTGVKYNIIFLCFFISCSASVLVWIIKPCCETVSNEYSAVN